MSVISDVYAREVLDSSGNPKVEVLEAPGNPSVEVQTKSGIVSEFSAIIVIGKEVFGYSNQELFYVCDRIITSIEDNEGIEYLEDNVDDLMGVLYVIERKFYKSDNYETDGFILSQLDGLGRCHNPADMEEIVSVIEQLCDVEGEFTSLIENSDTYKKVREDTNEPAIGV